MQHVNCIARLSLVPADCEAKNNTETEREKEK